MNQQHMSRNKMNTIDTKIFNVETRLRENHDGG